MSEARNEPFLQDMPPAEPAPAGAPSAVELPPTRRGGRRRYRWVFALLGLLAIGALVSVLWQPQLAPEPAPASPRSEASAAREAREPLYPIERTEAALPPLDASDAALLAALQAVWQGGGVASFVEPKDLARNFVATVDNLPRRQLPAQRWPLKPAAGTFGTSTSVEGLVIAEANARRYAPYVRLLETASAEQLVTLYVRYYPLFQQAYRELGYPDGHFNDRLVESIDTLLATPESRAALRVVQPKVFYEFADRDLEQLPAGQKLMLRIGRDHAATVKAKLREIRRLVTAQPGDSALGKR